MLNYTSTGIEGLDYILNGGLTSRFIGPEQRQ